MADAMDAHGDGLIPTAPVLEFLREEGGLRANGDEVSGQVRPTIHIGSIPVHSLERCVVSSLFFMCDPSEGAVDGIIFRSGDGIAGRAL